MSGPSAAEQVDAVVLGMGVAGESVAGQLAEAGLDVVGIDAVFARRGVPLLGLRPEQDDDSGGEPARRDYPGIRHGGHDERDAGLEPGRAAHPRGGHRRRGDTLAVERFEGKGGRFVRGTGRIRRAGSRWHR